MPWRIPDQLDIRNRNSLDLKQRSSHAGRDALVHRTAGRGECHGHFHRITLDGDAVNKTEVNEVAANFGIDHLSKGFENSLFVELVGGCHAGRVFKWLDASGTSFGRK